ncbi:30S ribosome-binding factor RbfA [Aquella oligotrophica]|uniref:Ribosome-binding factor A n=1 Tax=Aquella oligotrophica TaxID=2067065 RepID=A0A2I7N4U8_9NEIS|nr:30S ribosome-binding factor RbfA [Aquella oligotrophica]AUR51482.1 ribosome-binding factor A [Aquella oligotrophica]
MVTKKTNPRSGRMADQIHKDIMQILRSRVKDPRVSWVTVNDVEVTNDYSLATIYYTVMDSNEVDNAAKALEKAKGFIRSELSKGLTTYTVPQLKFVYDKSLERGSRILSLISQVSSEFTEDDEPEDQKPD